MWGFMSNSQPTSEQNEGPISNAPPMMFNPAAAPAPLSSKSTKNPLTRQKRPMTRPTASAAGPSTFDPSAPAGTLPTSLKSPTGGQEFFKPAPETTNNQNTAPQPPPPSATDDVNQFLNGYDFNNSQPPQQTEQNNHNNESLVDPGSTQHPYQDNNGDSWYNQAQHQPEPHHQQPEQHHQPEQNHHNPHQNENSHHSAESNNVQDSEPSSADVITDNSEGNKYPQTQEEFCYNYYAHYGQYPEEAQWTQYTQQWDEYYASQAGYEQQQVEQVVTNGNHEEQYQQQIASPREEPEHQNYNGQEQQNYNGHQEQQSYNPSQQEQQYNHQQQMSYPGQQDNVISPQGQVPEQPPQRHSESEQDMYASHQQRHSESEQVYQQQSSQPPQRRSESEQNVAHQQPSQQPQRRSESEQVLYSPRGHQQPSQSQGPFPGQDSMFAPTQSQEVFPPQQQSFPPQQEPFPVQQPQQSLLPQQDPFPPQQDPFPPQQQGFPPQQDFSAQQSQPSFIPQQPPQQSFPPQQQDMSPQTQPNFLTSFNPVEQSGNSAASNSIVSPSQEQQHLLFDPAPANTLFSPQNNSASLFGLPPQASEGETSQSDQTKSMEFMPPMDNQAFPSSFGQNSTLPFPEPSFDKCPSPVNPDNQFQKERDSTTPLWDKKDLNINNRNQAVNGQYFVPPISEAGPSNETEPFPPMVSPRTQGFPTQLMEDARARVVSESGSNSGARSRHTSERSSGGRSRKQSENFPSNESTGSGSRSRHTSENTYPYNQPVRKRTTSSEGRARQASGPYAGGSNPSTFIDHTNSAEVFATSPQEQAAFPQYLSQQPAAQPSFQQQAPQYQQPERQSESGPPPPLQFTDSFPTQVVQPPPAVAKSSNPPQSILPQGFAQAEQPPMQQPPTQQPPVQQVPVQQPPVQQPPPQQSEYQPPPQQSRPPPSFSQSKPKMMMPPPVSQNSQSMFAPSNSPIESKKEDVISPILPPQKTNYPPANFQPSPRKTYPMTNIAQPPLNSTGISSSTPKIMAPPAAPGPAKDSKSMLAQRLAQQMPPPNSYEHINISGRYTNKQPVESPSSSAYANHQLDFQPPRPSSRSSDDTLRRLRKAYEDNKIRKRTPEGSVTGNDSGFGLPLLSSTTNMNNSRPSSASGRMAAVSMKSLRESSTFQSTAELIAKQEAYENITLKTKPDRKAMLEPPSMTYENHDLPVNPALPPRPARNSPSIPGSRPGQVDLSRSHSDLSRSHSVAKKSHARHSSTGSREDSTRSETSSRYTDQPYDARAQREYRDHRRERGDPRYNDSFDRYRDPRDERYRDPRYDGRYDRKGPRPEDPGYRRYEEQRRFEAERRRAYESSMRAGDPYHAYHGYPPGGRYPAGPYGPYADPRYRPQRQEDETSLPATDTLSSLNDPTSLDNTTVQKAESLVSPDPSELDALLLSEESKPSDEVQAESEDLLDTEPVSEESPVEDVEEDSVEEAVAMADLFTTPYQYTQYHTRAQCFGPNRMVCIISADNDYEGPPPRLDIIDFKRLYWQELKELEAYPGPFIKGETPKRDVTAYCKKQANLARRHSTDNVLDDGKALLWELLALMCKQNGAVIGTDVAEILLADDMESEQPPQLPAVKFLVGDTPSVSSSESSVAPVPLLSEQDKTSALAKITNCLYEGQRREAMEISMKSGLWDTALMIGTTLNTDVMQEVMKRFSKSLHIDDPLRSFHQLISNTEPTSCAKPGMDWRKHLAIVLSNQSDKYDPGFKSVLAMADNLAEKGCTHAAHFCYIMSGVKLTAVTNKTSKMALLGLDHRKAELNSLPYTAIQQTEVYEYAKSLGGETCIVPYQATKLFYAKEVCKVGQYNKGLQYLHQICLHINSSPKLYRARFIHCVLEEGLRIWSLLNGREEHPQWLQDVKLSLTERHLLKSNRSTAYSSRVATPEIRRVTQALLDQSHTQQQHLQQQFLSVVQTITPADSPSQYIKNDVQYPTETASYTGSQQGVQVTYNAAEQQVTYAEQQQVAYAEQQQQQVYAEQQQVEASAQEAEVDGAEQQADNGFVFDGVVYRHPDYPGYCFYEGQWYPDPNVQQQPEQPAEQQPAEQQPAEQQPAEQAQSLIEQYQSQQYNYTEQQDTADNAQYNEGGYTAPVEDAPPPTDNALYSAPPTDTYNRTRLDTLTSEPDPASPTEAAPPPMISTTEQAPPMAFFNPSSFGGGSGAFTGGNILAPMSLDPGVLSDEEVKTPTNDQPEDNLQDIDEDSLYSKKPKQARSEVKKEEPVMEKKKEESGGIFSRLFKKKNQMILPDDSKPTMVWDDDLKKWINTEEPDGGTADAPPPPPTMSAPSSNPPSVTGSSDIAHSAPTSPRSTPSLRRKGGRLGKSRYVDVLGASSMKKSATAPDFLK